MHRNARGKWRAKTTARASLTTKHRPSAPLRYGLVALFMAVAASLSRLDAQAANATAFPSYDHVFLVIMENEGYN